MTDEAKPETFGDISDERQWEWDREIELMRDFIDSKGLDAELVVYARKAADAERVEVMVDRLQMWPRKDLATIAVGMPYLGESKKDAIIRWLIEYRPDIVEKELELI
jgi:hypothetical protein